MNRVSISVLAAAACSLAAGCNSKCSDLAQEYHDSEAKAQLCDPSQSDPCPFTLPVSASAKDGMELSSCMAAYDAGAGAQLRVLYEEYQKNGCPMATITCGSWDGTGAVCRVVAGASSYTCAAPLP